MDELKEYSKSRHTARRKYSRLVWALTCLVEAGVMKPSEAAIRRVRVDALYARLMKERRKTRPKEVRAAGRPGDPERASGLCRKPGCELPAVNGYCSVEHAPLAHILHKVPVTAGGE